MSAERLTYLDSSAIVKLVRQETGSAAVRAFVRRRALVSSALAHTEVLRAAARAGDHVVRRAGQTIAQIDLLRISDRVLDDAARLPPLDLRTLDAIHLATAQLLGDDLRQLVTYDDRMAAAARQLGLSVVAPT